MSYLFDGLWAIDPLNPANVAINSQVVIFDPTDETHTPIALTDGDGLVLPNPLTTNDKGFVGAFRASLDRVGWDAMGLTGYLTSYDGLKSAADQSATAATVAAGDAKEAREASELSRIAAEKASELVEAPSDTVMAATFQNPATLSAKTLDGLFTRKGSIMLVATDHGVVADPLVDSGAAMQGLADLVRDMGGGMIIFPPGIYYWSRAVELGDNTTLEGPAATLIKRGGDESYAFFTTRSHGQHGYGSGGSRIRVNSLRFLGDFANNITPCAFGLHHTDDFIATSCKFEQMSGTGHIADLGGCSNITFRDCLFLGALDNGSRAEAIQIDLSSFGALSVLDDPGSYDGLPTISVTVDNCKFLPLTVGATTYPAPVPLGSHSVWEGRWFKDIKFLNNTVIDPRPHTGTNPVGVIHFSAIDGLTVSGNKFICQGRFGVRVIGVYRASSGRAAGDDPNVAGSSVTFTTPMRAKNINITNDNYFEGWTSAVAQVAYIDGAEDVDLSGNGWSGCASMFDLRDIIGLTWNGNKFRKAATVMNANPMNLNKISVAAGSGNVIDASAATTLTNLVNISNVSERGGLNGNTVIGLGANGIKQAAGSTLDTAGNVLI